MPDILGYRAKLGILIPSTNSSVQPETDAMRPEGVTNQIERLRVSNVAFRVADDAHRIVREALADLEAAVGSLATCNPDHLILAMAVPCFWGGQAGCDAIRARMAARSGLGVTLPPEALCAALAALGARRIGIVTPYLPAADHHVSHFFEEAGFAVSGILGLRAPTEDQVVAITPEALRGALRELARPDVDALVHVGTSIAMARLVEPFEREFGRPVVSVNVACYWAALRATGIADRQDGHGILLRDY